MTWVYTTDAPVVFVLVPVTDLFSLAFVRVRDTGVEGVERGRSVRMEDVETASPSETFEASVPF